VDGERLTWSDEDEVVGDLRSRKPQIARDVPRRIFVLEIPPIGDDGKLRAETCVKPWFSVVRSDALSSAQMTNLLRI